MVEQQFPDDKESECRYSIAGVNGEFVVGREKRMLMQSLDHV